MIFAFGSVGRNRAIQGLAAAIFMMAGHAGAFPELARLGYANCITCHYSANGSGLLTPYGRALSGDRMSTWTREGEERFAYGAVETPDWLAMGGDIRGLGLFQNRPNRQTTQFMLMQADAEAAVTLGKFVADITGGVDYAGNPISRRHYISYRPTDQLQFRVGRFLPTVGINTENHSIALRRGIGRDQGTESYNVEAAWIDEKFDVFATAILGRPDNLQLGAETGGAVSASVFLRNRFKVGASYFYGSRDVATRHAAGPFFILGFTDRFFAMIDTAVQWLTPTGKARVTGFADYVRLDYEVAQGFHVYATQELSFMDINTPGSYADAYGLGVQWFPRPHLEVNATYQKNRFGGSGTPLYDYAFVMTHFYL